MRKKQVIELNKSLTEKLAQADNFIKDKENDLAVANDKISLLETKINDLQKEIECLHDEQKIIEEHFPDFDYDEFEKNLDENKEDVVLDFTELEFIEDTKNIDKASLQDYAVACVSKIVLETSKAQLSLLASNLDCKERLIEQLLGKSESSKIKVFTILDENLSEFDTKLKIDVQFKETVDYINDLICKIRI